MTAWHIAFPEFLFASSVTSHFFELLFLSLICHFHIQDSYPSIEITPSIQSPLFLTELPTLIVYSSSPTWPHRQVFTSIHRCPIEPPAGDHYRRPGRPPEEAEQVRRIQQAHGGDHSWPHIHHSPSTRCTLHFSNCFIVFSFFFFKFSSSLEVSCSKNALDTFAGKDIQGVVVLHSWCGFFGFKWILTIHQTFSKIVLMIPQNAVVSKTSRQRAVNTRWFHWSSLGPIRGILGLCQFPTGWSGRHAKRFEEALWLGIFMP